MKIIRSHIEVHTRVQCAFTIKLNRQFVHSGHNEYFNDDGIARNNNNKKLKKNPLN